MLEDEYFSRVYHDELFGMVRPTRTKVGTKDALFQTHEGWSVKRIVIYSSLVDVCS